MTQALSAVGSLALILAVGLGWWFSDIREKASAAHKDYIEVGKEAATAEKRAAEEKRELLEMEDELNELKAQAEKSDKQLKDGDDRLSDVASLVDVLRARADVHWRILSYLSFALTPVGEDRDALEKKILDAGFQTDRASFSKVSHKEDTIVFFGQALFEEEVPRLIKRLRAAGYLARPRKHEVVRKVDQDYQKPYFLFEVSAELRYPPIVDLED